MATAISIMGSSVFSAGRLFWNIRKKDTPALYTKSLLFNYCKYSSNVRWCSNRSSIISKKPAELREIFISIGFCSSAAYYYVAYWTKMEGHVLEIVDSPLPKVNGLYYPSNGGVYKHSSGKLIITLYQSKWAICSGSNALCISTAVIDDPTKAQWEYFSAKIDTYKKSKNMKAKYVVQSSAVETEAGVDNTEYVDGMPAEVLSTVYTLDQTNVDSCNGHAEALDTRAEVITEEPAKDCATTSQQQPDSLNVSEVDVIADRTTVEPAAPPQLVAAPGTPPQGGEAPAGSSDSAEGAQNAHHDEQRDCDNDETKNKQADPQDETTVEDAVPKEDHQSAQTERNAQQELESKETEPEPSIGVLEDTVPVYEVVAPAPKTEQSSTAAELENEADGDDGEKQDCEDGYDTPTDGEVDASIEKDATEPVDSVLPMSDAPVGRPGDEQTGEGTALDEFTDMGEALPMEPAEDATGVGSAFDVPELSIPAAAASVTSAGNTAQDKNRFAEKFAAAIASQPAAAFPLNKGSGPASKPAFAPQEAPPLPSSVPIAQPHVQSQAQAQGPPGPGPYRRPIPVLRTAGSASNWRVLQETDWFGRVTETYYNVVTDETVAKMPDCLRNSPNVSSFVMETRSKNQIEVFAPTSCLRELQKQPVNASCLTEWRDIEPFWTSTVASYEHEVATLNHYLRNFRAHAAAEATAREKALRDSIADLQASLQASKDREQVSQQRADTMMARTGKSHIKRDWQQTKVDSDFPAGEDIRAEFLTSFLNFETFACDAVNTLEDHDVDDAAAVFVRNVMLPLFEATKSFVTKKLDEKKLLLTEKFGVALPSDEANSDESVVKLFWYSTQQAQLPKEIAALEDQEIDLMIDRMDPGVSELHSHMLEAAVQGLIDDGESNLRINAVVRILLRFHTVAALSDPRCFLHPAPGARLPYKEGLHLEILSPGVKQHGRIKEGDTVEVVLPGLYFDYPDVDVKPIAPPLVRRLLSSK